jgi:hypothetical protein
VAGPCGAGASCDFRGPVKARRGFEQAEVFLSGFRLEAGTQADAIQQVSATARRFRYDAATGEVEVGLAAVFRTRSQQNYSYRLTFVVVLTSRDVARFTTVGGGCAGTARCHIVKSLPGAVPKGWQYIGLASSLWHLGAVGGPILLNTVSGHVDSLTVAPPNVNVDYLCVLHGQRPQNDMFCEWDAKVIAFDPAEMTQNGSPLFPQYTFLNWNTTQYAGWSNRASQPARQRIPGFLDAFEGLSLTYQIFPPSMPAQNAVWSIEASAQRFRVDPVLTDTAITDYGVFLGTTFGNWSSATAFGYQSSRAFGFLR